MKELLHTRYFGQEGNPPLVILHGLLGSSRNWTSMGAVLAQKFDTFALDLRNHGGSFHDDDPSIPAMAEDLGRWLEDKGLEKVHLMGHKPGRKSRDAIRL